MAKDDLFSRINQAAKNRVQRVLNSTKLDENISTGLNRVKQSFKNDPGQYLPTRSFKNLRTNPITAPQTGTIARAGSQVLENVGRSQPVQFAVKNFAQPYLNTQNKPLRVLQQVAKGYGTGANLGLVQGPGPQPQGASENIANVVGGFAGAMNPYTASGKFYKGVNVATNPYLSKIVGRFAPGVAQRGASAVANVAQGIGIDRGLGQQTSPLSVGVDAVSGLAMGRAGFDIPNAKGFGTGRNSSIPWNKEDLDLLDNAMEYLQTNRKLTNQAQAQLDDVMSKLADGYLYKDQINKIADRSKGNQRKFLIDLGKELQKSYRNVGEEINIPKLGIADNQPKLKLKTDLLNQANELRKVGQNQLELNRNEAQLNKELRNSVSDEIIKSINKIKRSVNRGNFVGDIETLRASKLGDDVNKVVEAIQETHPEVSDEMALDMALKFPTKASTVVSRPQELIQAREIEKQASQVKDIVYNASPNPETTSKILAKNQSVIEKTAKQDFDQWNRAVKQQETPRTLTGAVNDAVNAIKNNTKSAVSNPEKLNDISPISSKFRDVYRNFERVFGDSYKQVKAQILDPFDKSKGDMVREQLQLLDNVENKIVNGLGIDKGSKLSGLVQLYGEGKITLDELKKQAGADYNKVIEADKFFRSEYDRLLNEVNTVRSKIYPNNPEKIIPRRNDYYRHFKEMSDGIQGLKNIFETPANISSELASVSYKTKPFAKWLSFAQKRTGDLTDIDAIGGYLDYIKAATYAKHIDPHTKVFRDLADELADSTLPDTKYPGKVNNFITFLSRYADDLAGKTNAGDRELQEAMGRRAFKVLNWVNNRVKANVIVGNASSSLAQIFNVPQGIANAGFRYAPINSVKTLKNMVLDRNSYSKSNFITERYQSGEFNRFDKGMLANTKKFAEWITGVLDEYGTKYIWDMHYQKALKENLGDPIKYADDITRKMVAGRGVGEVPLGQKSKVFQLVAPFQLEVGNMWWIMKDWTDNKQFDKLAKFFVLTYVFNKGAEAVRGSGVAIDPIQAMVDSWGVITDEEDNKALRVGGRLSGEVLSNLPIGQTVAGAYPEYGFKVGGKQLPTREEFFGDADPTRFGSGLLAIKGFQDPIYKLGFPYGGQQIKRFIEGANAYQKGYSESPSGRVRFPIKQGVIPAVQSSVFGQYSTPQAREYFDKDRTTLGEKQSDKFKSLSPDEAQKYYQEVMDNREGTSKTSGSVFSVDKASASDSVVLPETEQGRAYLYNQDKKIIDNYEQDVIDTQYKTYANEDNRQKRLDELEQRYQGALARQEMFDKDYPQLSKDAEYESKATTGNYDDRYSLIKNELRQVFNPTSKKEVFDYLAQNQRKVNGKKLVTVPVLDDLYKEGIITKFERDLLKSVSFTKDGQIKFKLPTALSGSSRKRKVFTFKPSKINHTKLRINVPELPRIKTQFNTARLNTPVLPRVKLA